MPRGYVRWESPADPDVPRFAFAVAAVNAKLPDPSEVMSVRDKTIFFLHTAAEIEHSLLVQYLYAAFSLGEVNARADLTDAQKIQTASWQSSIRTIAKQEMGHLITVQNLLRLVGGPLNLEREDFPFRNDYYPFPFHLEPLTKGSLAKYIAAEMPENPDDPDGFVADAVRRTQAVSDGLHVNRVGPLYARLTQLFEDEVGLPDSELAPDTAASFQATGQEWNPGGFPMIVKTFGGTPQQARAAALSALHDIAAEGEGWESPGAGAAPSHFDRFLEIYRAFPESQGSYPYAWKPALAVPCHPNTAPSELSDAHHEQGRISHPVSVGWARLFNLRYRMLLTFLQQSLLTSRAAATAPDRSQLIAWTFSEMFRMSSLSQNVLTRLPRQKPNIFEDGRPSVAGAPFELPYALLAPDRDSDRWRTVLDLLDASKTLGEQLAVTAPSDPARQELESINQNDARIRAYAEQHLAGSGSGGGGGAPLTPEAAMLELIRSKRPIAQGTHDFVEVDPATTLQALFQAGTEASLGQILEFLRTGSYGGKKLIVAQQPDNSHFVKLITTGPMQNVFSQSERDVVRVWIMSLA